MRPRNHETLCRSTEEIEGEGTDLDGARLSVRRELTLAGLEVSMLGLRSLAISEP